MIQKIISLKGKKVYINFDNCVDYNFVHNIYGIKDIKYNVVKSIGNRVNWVFKHDLTIPLNVFDQMIGINMDTYNHVVLLCKNYIAYGDKML